MQCSISLPSTVTFTLNLHGLVTGFAHLCTEVKILWKCYENPSSQSSGWRDMQRKYNLIP